MEDLTLIMTNSLLLLLLTTTNYCSTFRFIKYLRLRLLLLHVDQIIITHTNIFNEQKRFFSSLLDSTTKNTFFFLSSSLFRFPLSLSLNISSSLLFAFNENNIPSSSAKKTHDNPQSKDITLRYLSEQKRQVPSHSRCDIPLRIQRH